MENKTNIKFKPAVTKRASEIIYEEIAKMITSGQLKPGDRLPSERAMIEMFDRSRPTIREALRMLERNGFIQINAGSNGAEVRNPRNYNLQESLKTAVNAGNISLEELSEYRIVSEVATAVWACSRRSEEDVSAMKELLKLSQTQIGNIIEFVTLDAEFHDLVAKAAGNSVSGLVNRALRSANEMYMIRKMESLSPEIQLQMANKVQRQHTAVLDAIEKKDPVAAEKAMKNHMENFGIDLKPETKAF